MKIVYYKVNLDEATTKLRVFFHKKSNILIAVVFGSATRREEVRDLDIAVYFREKPDIMEICKLASEIEDLVRMPVDGVPLDEAPPKLLAKILSKEVVVKIADRKLLTRLMKTALSEIMDMEFKLRANNAVGKTHDAKAHRKI